MENERLNSSADYSSYTYQFQRANFCDETTQVFVAFLLNIFDLAQIISAIAAAVYLNDKRPYTKYIHKFNFSYKPSS